MDSPAPVAESGLRAIFLQERPTLLRLLTARLGRAEEAEDALQEAWLKLDTVSAGPIGSPVAYLFRMVHNAALDARRTAVSRSVREAHWLDAQPTAIQRPGAEAALAARQRLQHVEAALAALPDPVSQVFRMFRLDGVPQKQIAAQLGLSLSTVEKLLQRAYRQIHDTGREPAAGSAPRRRLLTKEQQR